MPLLSMWKSQAHAASRFKLRLMMIVNITATFHEPRTGHPGILSPRSHCRSHCPSHCPYLAKHCLCRSHCRSVTVSHCIFASLSVSIALIVSVDHTTIQLLMLPGSILTTTPSYAQLRLRNSSLRCRSIRTKQERCLNSYQPCQSPLDFTSPSCETV